MIKPKLILKFSTFEQREFLVIDHAVWKQFNFRRLCLTILFQATMLDLLDAERTFITLGKTCTMQYRYKISTQSSANTNSAHNANTYTESVQNTTKTKSIQIANITTEWIQIQEITKAVQYANRKQNLTTNASGVESEDPLSDFPWRFSTQSNFWF